MDDDRPCFSFTNITITKFEFIFGRVKEIIEWARKEMNSFKVFISGSILEYSKTKNRSKWTYFAFSLKYLFFRFRTFCIFFSFLKKKIISFAEKCTGRYLKVTSDDLSSKQGSFCTFKMILFSKIFKAYIYI